VLQAGVEVDDHILVLRLGRKQRSLRPRPLRALFLSDSPAKWNPDFQSGGGRRSNSAVRDRTFAVRLARAADFVLTVAMVG
jgi:hypothetical protein